MNLRRALGDPIESPRQRRDDEVRPQLPVPMLPAT
jgi:hypothetical protein